MQPDTMRVCCATGEGHLIGLPTVAEDMIESTLVWIRSAVGNDPLLMKLLDDTCTECDMPAGEMDDEDDEAHMIIHGFVVIGCEGFHTAALRYAVQQV